MTLNNVLKDAWEIGKKKCGFLVLFGLASAIVGSLSSKSSNQDSIKVLQKIAEGDMQGAKAMQELAKNPPMSSVDFILIIIGVLLSIYVSIALYRYVKKIVDDEDVDFKELLNSSVKVYGMFFVKSLLYGLAVGLGLMLCVLPGIYLLVRLAFVQYIAANEPELSVSETFSKSMNLTKDKFWDLLGYGIVAILIVLSGFLLCCVGYLFTAPLSAVFMGVVYKELVQESYIPESAPESSENNEVQ